MRDEVRFFESGFELLKGSGDLRTALGELVQLAAQDANSTSASFYIADWSLNGAPLLLNGGVELRGFLSLRSS